jgi:hypothetical protein
LKKINLGQTVSTLANVGIVASIIFLAMEVRDNATQTRVDSVQVIVGQFVAWQAQIADNDALAEIYTTGLADFDQLSETEKTRFDSLMRSYLNIVGQAMAARGEGVIIPDVPIQGRAVEGGLSRHLDQPGFRRWWATADQRDIIGSVVEIIDHMESLRK